MARLIPAAAVAGCEVMRQHVADCVLNATVMCPLIPAVTLVDGSYDRLIHRVYERNGMPMVLNISIIENLPIFSKPTLQASNPRIT